MTPGRVLAALAAALLVAAILLARAIAEFEAEISVTDADEYEEVWGV